MTDTTTPTPVVRHALIGNYSVGDERDIARYLPSNYHIAFNSGIYRLPDGRTGILIEGHDVAGWTLDAYVLPRLASGCFFGSEVFYCLTCGSHDHNQTTCPDERLVYAVRVDDRDGDYMYVADDLATVASLVGSPVSYGQCQNCGGFGTLYSTSETPKAFSIRYSEPTPVAQCDGCGIEFPIRPRRAKEVCF